MSFLHTYSSLSEKLELHRSVEQVDDLIYKRLTRLSEQSLAMARVVLKTILHAAAVGAMGFGYHSLQKLPMDRWIREQYGGHFQYLTIQG